MYAFIFYNRIIEILLFVVYGVCDYIVVAVVRSIKVISLV